MKTEDEINLGFWVKFTHILITALYSNLVMIIYLVKYVRPYDQKVVEDSDIFALILASAIFFHVGIQECIPSFKKGETFLSTLLVSGFAVTIGQAATGLAIMKIAGLISGVSISV
ncbi:hypothetical protein H6775_01885 [Candidatus Nomurabacteria bacterium]|nr:hypothetical protein [Candidatus Nomurabacteria bacterium]